MRRAAVSLAFVLLSSLLGGCENSNPPGMPAEPPKELPEDYRNKMKNMNPIPTKKPVEPKAAPAEKPAPQK